MVTSGVDFATWNWKIYLLESSISFPALFYLNKKVLSSWTLIARSPSRQHSFSDGLLPELSVLFAQHPLCDEDTDLQDEKQPWKGSHSGIWCLSGCWAQNVDRLP